MFYFLSRRQYRRCANTPANDWYFLGAARHRETKPPFARSNPRWARRATAKFPGEIYRATCTGKCRGPVARFVAKIFAAAFSMFSSRDACVRAWYWRVMRASAVRTSGRTCMYTSYTYTSYPMTMERSLSLPGLSPLFFGRINAGVLIYRFPPSPLDAMSR